MDSSHQGGMVSEELQRGAVERTSGWRVVARWQRARCETPSLLYVQSVQNVTHSWARVPVAVRYPDAGERPQSKAGKFHEILKAGLKLHCHYTVITLHL